MFFTEFCSSEALTVSNLADFRNTSRLIFINFGILGRVCLKRPQDSLKNLLVGLLEPFWAQLGPKLASSWLKLGPRWPQVGSTLPQVGLMLDAFLGPKPPLDQPKPFQIPSQSPMPHPAGLAGG